MALLFVLVAAIALAVPAAFTWLPVSSVNYLLGVAMFGMGLSLKPSDFRIALAKPLPVAVGFAAQFTVMPLLAWALCKAFSLPPEIAIGVILVGCCPGGTASNIITYIAGGDVALSVCMTGFSTLAAPLLTPFLTWLLAGESVDVDAWAMLLSVLEVVIAPVALGAAANRYVARWVQKGIFLLPYVSVAAVCAIIGIVLSANADKVLSSGWLVVSVVALHNLAGFALGYFSGAAARLSRTQKVTVAIEVGMQNSGLAAALAAAHFAAYPLATIPGAIFSVWHNISGAIVAAMFRKIKK